MCVAGLVAVWRLHWIGTHRNRSQRRWNGVAAQRDPVVQPPYKGIHMATWLKIMLGLVVALAAVIGVAMYATSGITKTADAFIKAAGSGDMAGARSYLTDAFQARDVESLESYLTRNGLVGMKQAKWSSRHVENGRGSLEGTITTASGGEVPVTVELVKEHNAWKLQSIDVSQSGLSPGLAATRKPELPDSATKLKLLTRSMRDFALSAKQGNMEYFRSTTATRFQQEFSTQALNTMFAGFMEHGDTFLSLSTTTPEPTSAPAIGDDGSMMLEGFYPAGSKRVTFNERYVLQDDDWKLIGFSLEVVDAPTEANVASQAD